MRFVGAVGKNGKMCSCRDQEICLRCFEPQKAWRQFARTFEYVVHGPSTIGEEVTLGNNQAILQDYPVSLRSGVQDG